MKSDEEIVEILEAFDLTRSYRDAGELAGCDHHTVAHWVERREKGELSATPAPKDQLIDPFLDECVNGRDDKCRPRTEWQQRCRGGAGAARRRSGQRPVYIGDQHVIANNQPCRRVPWRIAGSSNLDRLYHVPATNVDGDITRRFRRWIWRRRAEPAAFRRNG